MKRTKGHYIGYRNIHGTWIWNDDEKCHITDVDGDYKVNMAFYRKVCLETMCSFDIAEEGLLHWRKSVVIRGVYRSPPKRGSKRGRGRKPVRGRRPDSANKSSAEDGADPSTSTDVPDVDNHSEISFNDFYIYGDSSSEDEEQSGTLLFQFFDSPPSEVSS